MEDIPGLLGLGLLVTVFIILGVYVGWWLPIVIVLGLLACNLLSE